jgi:hypothetical protein
MKLVQLLIILIKKYNIKTKQEFSLNLRAEHPHARTQPA